MQASLFEHVPLCSVYVPANGTQYFAKVGEDTAIPVTKQGNRWVSTGGSSTVKNTAMAVNVIEYGH